MFSGIRNLKILRRGQIFYDHWEGNFDEARILVSGILKVEFLAQTDSASLQLVSAVYLMSAYCDS